jgi:hypothetical protein
MKLSEFKKLIRKGIMEELNEDENIQTGNSDVGLRNLYADNVNEASLKPEDIQRKYNEMFGKNPSTKFADVAKALGRPEEEVTMAFMGVNLPKLEEAEEDNVYGSFDSEQWYNKKTNTPFKGNFADFDEEEFDEFESMMKKYGDNRWFGKGESGKILFDMYKNKYGPMKVRTAKLEEAEEEEITITTPDSAEVEDIAAAEMSPEMDMAPSFGEEPTYTEEEAALMDDLDNGLKKAQELGDEKLSTLIGNIITYFTRQHVVKEGEAGRKKHYKGAVKDDKDQISKLKKDMKFDKKQLQKESLEILKMKKLAGLLKEGEYAKALLKEYELDDNKLQIFIDRYNKLPRKMGTLDGGDKSYIKDYIKSNPTKLEGEFDDALFSDEATVKFLNGLLDTPRGQHISFMKAKSQHKSKPSWVTGNDANPWGPGYDYEEYEEVPGI